MEPGKLTTKTQLPRATGFTLIELLVVLLVLTITIGIVGVNLGGNDTDRVRDEADRLVALLQNARDEAILQGQYLAVQFGENGYQFLHLDEKGKLAVLNTDDSLRPRVLPEGMSLSAEIEGLPTTEQAGLMLEPSGQLPPFVITFRFGEVRWYAVSEHTGRLRSSHTRETERAG